MNAGRWQPPLEAAIEAARLAGEVQLRGLGRARTVQYKGTTNLVTEIDLACEDRIVTHLSRAFPSHDFLLEEHRTHTTGSHYLWIIDPLDGTTNYTHRYPHFCCSIALAYRGKTVLGVVFDPVRNELFTGVRRRGAYLNGKRIRTSNEADLIRCLVATGFPYDIHRARDKNLRRFARVLYRVRSVRRSGSAALDLCYLAAGRLDGYWVLQLSPWDSAAGILIVEEAGGRVTDLAGGPADFTAPAFVASNGKIQQSLLRLLSGPPRRKMTRSPRTRSKQLD